MKNAVKRLLAQLAIVVFCGIGGVMAQLASKQIQYLSGTDNEHTVAWDFWCTGGRNSGYWTKIQVPSCWEQQGFGSYNYGRDYVTYGKNFRFADEKGLYKYDFTIPANWKDKDIELVFEGSMTDTEVKINGKTAGAKHQGAFYRFTYNITDKLIFNKANHLAVTVSKMSSEATVNNAERLADYWIFGGIFRPVYLEATPREHISHFAVSGKADGSFSINVFLKGITASAGIFAEIIDANGSPVKKIAATINANDTLIHLDTQIDNPKLWTAETPNLYTVRLTLLKRGVKTYQTSDKFGFRTIEIRKQDGIYVNGVKIKMKGINRHVWWPETGRTVNPGIDLADVKLIKGMNMNAVRCSHYPPDQSFLRYCDSLGLYVLDELAGWQKAYSTKAGLPLVREMVTRDCNHPSIIFWSNGNEGGHNFNLDNQFALYDLSTRPVIHAHHKAGNAFNGIDCNHYEDYYSTQKILADTNIYMVTEFNHSQDDGGGGAGLADMWDLHWNSKKGAGGFIWALLDEGIVRTDMNGKVDVNGINAPDGIVGPHREKEGSYNAIKEIYSPVKITMKALPADFDGTIPVENRYNFTNLNQCTYHWELVNFNKPAEYKNGLQTIKQGDITAPSILPVQKGSLHIPLPADWKNYDGLTFTAYDQYHQELYKWVWKTTGNSKLLTDIFKTAGTNAVTTTETDSLVSLKANGITVTISKITGSIVKLNNDNSKDLSFKNGPVLVGGNASFVSLKHTNDGDNHIIESTYTGDIKKLRWTMYPSGWLELAYEYAVNGDYQFSGLTFTYPENYVFGAKWLGQGPYRVWKNRPEGAALNVWKNMNNNTQTGSAPWIFPEFKGYFGQIVWMEMDTAEGKFTIATKEDNLFVRLFDFWGMSGPAPLPQLPAGNISFLDNIPPVGSKLAFNMNGNTTTLGPLSEPNHLKGTIARTLYFYFGLPPAKTGNNQFVMPAENILMEEKKIK